MANYFYVHLQKPTRFNRLIEDQMRARTHLPFILFMIYAINVCAQNPTSVDTEHNLMPVPASARFNAGKLIIDKPFTFSTTDQNDARLEAGLDRMLHRLEGRTLLELGHTPVKDAAGCCPKASAERVPANTTSLARETLRHIIDDLPGSVRVYPVPPRQPGQEHPWAAHFSIGRSR